MSTVTAGSVPAGTINFADKLKCFKAKINAYFPVPFQYPLTLHYDSTESFSSWSIDTIEAQTVHREKLLNPQKISSSEEEESDEEDAKAPEEPKEELTELEVFNEIAKVQHAVGVTVAAEKVFLWTLAGDGNVSRVPCDSNGKLSGPGKLLSKTLTIVYNCIRHLPHYLSSYSSSTRKLPHSEWSAYAPFWSDIFPRCKTLPSSPSVGSVDSMQSPPPTPSRFHNLECYGSLFDEGGVKGKFLLLVDPIGEGEVESGNVNMRGLVVKVDGDDGVVIVLVFKEYYNYCSVTGEQKEVLEKEMVKMKEMRRGDLGIEGDLFVKRRVRYV